MHLGPGGVGFQVRSVLPQELQVARAGVVELQEGTHSLLATGERVQLRPKSC